MIKLTVAWQEYTGMNVRHEDSDLERLERDASFNGKFSPAVVESYRRKMQFIRAAADERDFRQMRSLNFEKLRGDREGQYSMRLNNQFRLILEIEQNVPKNTIVIIEIADYH